MESKSIITTVDNAHKSNKISIRPYFDPERDNLGLEKYGMSLFDGVFHYEQLAAVEQNGNVRYLSGLNEYAPEVLLIEDKEEREAKIKEIRTVVAQVEKQLAANLIDIEDEKFWDKVKLLHPTNVKFWDKIEVKCGNEPTFLDPVREIYDLVKIYAIEAGGFSMVAPSYEAAREMSVPPKFYLDKSLTTLSSKTAGTKLRNKALSLLQTYYDEDMTKLFYIAKNVDGNCAQYKKNTPNDIIYDNMDKFITGLGVERNAKRAAEMFTNAAKLDMESLKLKAIVRDASFYHYITVKSDGMIYHTDLGTPMGRNVAECIEFLKNALNEDVLDDLMFKVEKMWNS